MIDIEKVREALDDETKYIYLAGGLNNRKNLEQSLVIFQRIRDNQLPVLYLAPKNSAVIVNANEYKETLTELERLQKKEVAMKVKIETLGVFGIFNPNLISPSDIVITCPKCNAEINQNKNNYCHRCGQKLDWSDEK